MRLLLFAVLAVAAATKEPVRVAVVGAGIGGSSAAYFTSLLRQSADIELDVYDSHVPGGRMKHTVIDDVVVETGGAIAVSVNYYMQNFTDLLGLERQTPPHFGRRMGIYDGTQFTFSESSWKAVTVLSMFWRYGMLALLRMKGVAQTMGDRFLQLYPVLARGEGFATPEGLLDTVNLYNLTKTSLRQHLIEAGLTQRLIDEFATGLARVNYGQDTGLNALAGSIALFPTLGGSDSLWSVKGGFRQIVQRLLRLSDANVFINRKVTAVYPAKTRGKWGRQFEVLHKSSQDAADSGTHKVYDAVIIAAPLGLSRIDISSLDAAAVPTQEYQITHTNVVKGLLRPEYFGLGSVEDIPPSILTTENDDMLPFSSFGTLKVYPNRERLVKIFSRKPLTDETLNRMFSFRHSPERHEWYAYPHYSPPERFAPFELTPGVYYVNALEPAGSCFEVEAVAARNCVNLMAKYLNLPHGADRMFVKPTTAAAVPEKQDL